ncbi:MAG: radical domain protein [Evtepia sp.]|jgi:TatD family-associated radical SAM protein|nr:radical domain protein [Evtepia sp.]
MTITYEYGDGLYINLTNRCDCACVFCIRKNDSEAIFDHNLWLPQEPSREDALADILSWDLTQFSELVFCGYGEPTYRIDEILWICDRLREAVSNLPPIRLNTNGHGSLINERNIVPELAGRLDRISVSLNASTPTEYCAVTRPRAGMAAWDAMLEFVRESAKVVPEVVLTVVDYEKSSEELEACNQLATNLGVILRVRSYTES